MNYSELEQPTPLSSQKFHKFRKWLASSDFSVGGDGGHGQGGDQSDESRYGDDDQHLPCDATLLWEAADPVSQEIKVTDSGQCHDPRDAQEQHHAPDAQHVADQNALDPAEFHFDNFVRLNWFSCCLFQLQYDQSRV